MAKQRLLLNGSNYHDDRLTSHHLKPTRKVFENQKILFE